MHPGGPAHTSQKGALCPEAASPISASCPTFNSRLKVPESDLMDPLCSSENDSLLIYVCKGFHMAALALAAMAQLVRASCAQKGCGFDPWLGCGQEATNPCFSLTPCFSPSPSLESMKTLPS